MISPSGVVVISWFDPVQKLPPWMNTSTGSLLAGCVPSGLTTFRLRQSSEVLVMLVKVNGGASEFGGCGQAAPKLVASTTEPAAGTCGRGGLNRFSPEVSSPYRRFRNTSSPLRVNPLYVTFFWSTTVGAESTELARRAKTKLSMIAEGICHDVHCRGKSSIQVVLRAGLTSSY